MVKAIGLATVTKPPVQPLNFHPGDGVAAIVTVLLLVFLYAPAEGSIIPCPLIFNVSVYLVVPPPPPPPPDELVVVVGVDDVVVVVGLVAVTGVVVIGVAVGGVGFIVVAVVVTSVVLE